MIIIAKLILLTVMIVMALKIVMSEGMLLERLGNWFEYKVADKYEGDVLVEKGNKFYDLFICPWCMNSIQSLTAHAFAFGLGILPLEFNWQLIIRLPLVIFGSSFISGNLWNLYQTINNIKDRNEAQENYYNVRANEILGDFEEDGLDDEDKKKAIFESINN